MMTLKSARSLFAVGTLMLAACSMQAQSSATVTGTLSDAMCGKKHATPSAAGAKCTKECVKGGSDYALVSGDKVYTLKGDKMEMDKFAGTSVTVMGDSDGKTITVKSIKAAS